MSAISDMINNQRNKQKQLQDAQTNLIAKLIASIIVSTIFFIWGPQLLVGAINAVFNTVYECDLIVWFNIHLIFAVVKIGLRR